MPDEAMIATAFEALVAEFPDVSAGSYPVGSGAENGQNAEKPYNVAVSLEGKDGALVDTAVERLRRLLAAHCSDSKSQSDDGCCVVDVLQNVDSLPGAPG